MINLKNKKGVGKIEFIFGAVIIGSILLMILFQRFPLASLLFGGAEFNCGDSGLDLFSCSVAGKSSVAIPSNAGETFSVPLNFGSQTDYFNALCNKLDTLSNGDCTAISQSLGTDSTGSPRTATWRGQIRQKFKEQFVKQLILIEATYENQTFKFYGLCETDQTTCKLVAPTGVENLPKWDAYVNPSSILIYTRKGGYSELDFVNPSTPEEYEVAEIIQEQESQTQIPLEESKTPSEVSVNEQPFSLAEWFSNLWKKIIGWFRK